MEAGRKQATLCVLAQVLKMGLEKEPGHQGLHLQHMALTIAQSVMLWSSTVSEATLDSKWFCSF
jgi:hypothetical protein